MLYSDNNPIVSFTVIAHFSLWSIRTSLRSTCLTSPSVCFLPPLICLHGDKLRHWCNRTDRGSARMCLSARVNHSVVQPATQQQTAGEKPCRETREPTWPWYRNDWMMHIYNCSHLQAVCCFLGWSTSCPALHQLIYWRLDMTVCNCRIIRYVNLSPAKVNSKLFLNHFEYRHCFQTVKLTQQMSCSCPAKHNRSTSYSLSEINRIKQSL